MAFSGRPKIINDPDTFFNLKKKSTKAKKKTKLNFELDLVS